MRWVIPKIISGTWLANNNNISRLNNKYLANFETKQILKLKTQWSYNGKRISDEELPSYIPSGSLYGSTEIYVDVPEEL